jgi:hypothetical protein
MQQDCGNRKTLLLVFSALIVMLSEASPKKKPHCHGLFTAVGVPLKGVLRAGAIRYWRIEEGNALITPLFSLRILYHTPHETSFSTLTVSHKSLKVKRENPKNFIKVSL